MAVEKDDYYVGADPALRELARKGHELEFFFVPTGQAQNPLIVKFMAFLTAYEDSYESEWTADKVYGRMDPIATFKGTTRKISLGWAVPAYSNNEAEYNLKKISKLIAMCYPVYGGTSNSSRGAGQITGAPLIKLRFANLISNVAAQGDVVSNGLLGWIDGISFKPNLDAGFYDPSVGKLYPKQLDLSCVFHALHQHNLGWTRDSGKINGAQVNSGGIERANKASNFPYGSLSTAGIGGKYPDMSIPAEPAPAAAETGIPTSDTSTAGELPAGIPAPDEIDMSDFGKEAAAKGLGEKIETPSPGSTVKKAKKAEEKEILQQSLASKHDPWGDLGDI